MKTIKVERKYKETAIFQITGCKLQYSHLFFSSKHLPKHDVMDHFCPPSILIQMQELQTAKEKRYFSVACVFTPARFSLLTATFLQLIAFCLPRLSLQFQLDFALFPPCPYPLVLRCCTWLNSFHVPPDRSPSCTAAWNDAYPQLEKPKQLRNTLGNFVN